MESGKDHTKEVEKRVVAIPIKASDVCGFFQLRESALLTMRQCWNCAFARFDANINPIHSVNPDGFCKFKK